MTKIRQFFNRIYQILKSILRRRLKITSEIFHTDIKDFFYDISEKEVENYNFVIQNDNNNLKYFREMDPDYQWPEGLTFDGNQNPCLLITGLKKTPEFLVDQTL